MRDWSAEVDSLFGELNRSIRGVAKRVRSALGDSPLEVLGYRGYGNARTALVHGRVVARRGVGPSSDADSTLENLLNTYRRADSDPVPSAQLAITFGDTSATMTSDDEGFFGGRISLTSPLRAPNEWVEFKAELLSPAQAGGAVSGMGEILLPSASACFGVISDIDDTVIQSRVSNFLLAAKTVMLGNARTRLPFPGVAAFYRALRDGATGNEQNPMFYVSSSPWNIYDVITEFMDLQKIPRGPVLLRDWDIALGALASSRYFEHKGVAIRNILSLYPDLPFILIGDTSQHDPEIYRQVISDFPGRIRAVYIRDVTRKEERSASVKKLAEEILAAQSTLVLAEDTLGAARHAVEQGWINADALPGVREEKTADEGKTGDKVPTPDGGTPTSGDAPTVIGEPSA